MGFTLISRVIDRFLNIHINGLIVFFFSLAFLLLFLYNKNKSKYVEFETQGGNNSLEKIETDKTPNG